MAVHSPILSDKANQMKNYLHIKIQSIQNVRAITEDKKEFKMGVQTVLSKETFEYEQLTPTQLKKKCLNDFLKAFRTNIHFYLRC